jgi:hypothetical protein
MKNQPKTDQTLEKELESENQTLEAEIPFYEDDDAEAVDLDVMLGISKVKRKLGGRVFFLHPPTLEELDLMTSAATADTNMDLIRILEPIFQRRLKDPTKPLEHASFKTVPLLAWQRFFAELRDSGVTNPN